MADNKGDASVVPSVSEAFEVIRDSQSSFQSTEARLRKVEEAGKYFGETQQKMDEKLDGIYNLLAQWNTGSEPSSLPRSSRPFSPSPPPPHPTTLTADELTFLKKQDAGKISLQHKTLPPPHQSTHDPSSSHAYTTTDPTLTLQHGFTFTQNPSETQNQPKTSPHNQQTPNPQQVPIPETTRQHPQLDIQPHFNHSIARPKLDFPTFMGEEPYNWLRKCDKIFP
jgi:hypothetical protein